MPNFLGTKKTAGPPAGQSPQEPILRCDDLKDKIIGTVATNVIGEANRERNNKPPVGLEEEVPDSAARNDWLNGGVDAFVFADGP